MIKKISIAYLTPEMYVSGFHWDQDVESSYQKEGRIPDWKTVELIKKRGVKELFIDTERGVDVEAGVSQDQIESEGDQTFAAYADEKPAVDKKVSTSEELIKAREVHSRAKGMIETAMQKALHGEDVDVDGFKELANDFIDSVTRNQNALACLSRIREKDAYLLEHSINVGVLMSILGKAMNLNRQSLFENVLGAILHDIGKILIPDEVLHKPGRLTEEEFGLMKKHSTFSRDILVKSGGLPQASLNVAYQHHERLDGTGYPQGLNKDTISLEAKMAAVVDVYDAITADRCYHKGLPPTIALKRMLEWTGSHLDKDILHTFIRAMGIYPVGSLVELTSGKLAVVIELNAQDQKQPMVKAIYHTKFKRFIKVELIDLTRKSTGEQIVRPSDPVNYGININDFLS
ncbi:HD-GYP domain-containing protein [Litoribacillus peritrichatus]|uniref:HD-GYP domain-containing protein n=1 Tax=Litoribacillus peritrichatus TaxID=718191 RepID=A0ABP7M2P8_9GAMM